MQYHWIERAEGQPVSALNRIGLVILVALFLPVTLLFLVFWGDAVGFWNQLLAAGLVVLLLSVSSMAINGAVTGKIRLSWFLAPIVIAAAIWLVLGVF